MLPVYCGLYSSVASITGKIVFSSDVAFHITEFCQLHLNSQHAVAPCGLIVIVLRAFLFVVMLSSNALMMAAFLTSLETYSTIYVTVISSSVDFLSSGILARLILSEQISSKWYMGATCIVIGITLVAYAQVESAAGGSSSENKSRRGQCQ